MLWPFQNGMSWACPTDPKDIHRRVAERDRLVPRAGGGWPLMRMSAGPGRPLNGRARAAGVAGEERAVGGKEKGQGGRSECTLSSVRSRGSREAEGGGRGSSGYDICRLPPPPPTLS